MSQTKACRGTLVGQGVWLSILHKQRIWSTLSHLASLHGFFTLFHSFSPLPCQMDYATFEPPRILAKPLTEGKLGFTATTSGIKQDVDNFYAYKRNHFQVEVTAHCPALPFLEGHTVTGLLLELTCASRQRNAVPVEIYQYDVKQRKVDARVVCPALPIAPDGKIKWERLQFGRSCRKDELFELKLTVKGQVDGLSVTLGSFTSHPIQVRAKTPIHFVQQSDSSEDEKIKLRVKKSKSDVVKPRRHSLRIIARERSVAPRVDSSAAATQPIQPRSQHQMPMQYQLPMQHQFSLMQPPCLAQPMFAQYQPNLYQPNFVQTYQSPYAFGMSSMGENFTRLNLGQEQIPLSPIDCSPLDFSKTPSPMSAIVYAGEELKRAEVDHDLDGYWADEEDHSRPELPMLPFVPLSHKDLLEY
jgi:hypothetical protein